MAKNNRVVLYRNLAAWIYLAAGLCIMGFGVALTIRADLGTSPISSVPYVGSLITGFTVGDLTVAMHCVMIAIQIALLRSRYHLLQLLQLPVAFLFGYATDLGLAVFSGLVPGSYIEQWLICLAGNLLVAVGVSVEVTADLVPLAGEGLILAICRVFPIQFPNAKIMFDCLLVAIAAAMSYLFLGTIEGIREGTLAAALAVGSISRFFIRMEERAFFFLKR